MLESSWYSCYTDTKLWPTRDLGRHTGCEKDKTLMLSPRECLTSLCLLLNHNCQL